MPKEDLQAKLKMAQTYRDEVILADQKVIYSTEKDLLEQSIDNLV